MNTPNNIDTINALRGAAAEIHSLRHQVLEIKAEAWDIHSELIKRMYHGSQVMSVCNAHRAEQLANQLEKPVPPPQSLPRLPNLRLPHPAPLPRTSMNTPMETLIARLISEGGALVSSNACSELEIADAQTTDRFHVDANGFGFVLRSQQWLDINKARENTPTKEDSQPGSGSIAAPASDAKPRAVKLRYLLLSIHQLPELSTPEEIKNACDLIIQVQEMSNGDRDCIKATFRHGPLFDGDVPCKTSRDNLIKNGFLTKVVVKGEGGFNACTTLGSRAFHLMAAGI